MLTDTAELLRRCRLFQKVPEGDVAQFARFVRRMRVDRGAVIVRENEGGRALYLIFSGVLIAKSSSVDGDDVAYGRIAPGEQFGHTAVLTGGPYTADVVALSDAHLGLLPAVNVRALIKASPAFTAALAEMLAREVRGLRHKLFVRNTLNLPWRIRQALAEMARSAGVSDNKASIAVPPTHAEMAALVGSRREAVTREFGRLAAAGIIGRDRHGLHILDVRALACAAG